MPEDRREPRWDLREPQRGEREPDPGERLRERIAAARESVETSLRDVLAELEREEAALRDDAREELHPPLDQRIEVAAQQAADRAVRGVERRIEAQAAHIDRALILVGEAERRMIGLTERVESAVRTAVRALELAAEVADWEQRIGSAADVEREVADRIVAAEGRLRDLVTDANS